MSLRRLSGLGTRLGIDRAVFLTLVGRVWGVGAGLVTIFFVTTALSPEQQGYYYTFYSLIALQVFAELGLNYAIVQFPRPAAACSRCCISRWSGTGSLPC